MKEDIVIGVLGGMGTYATIHLFEQYAKIFPAEKEWERPRIIIDNRCTMPSRVKAFLYSENVEKLVFEMSESLCNLAFCGCNKIILACNTSHLFLPEIVKSHLELQNRVVNIIDECISKIEKEKIKIVFLLASEGTIDSGVYQDKLSKYNIECLVPSKEEYDLLRLCIEAVKQNKYTEDVEHAFLDLINRHDACILGCTEMPILYERYKEHINCNFVFDPIQITLNNLKEEYGYD